MDGFIVAALLFFGLLALGIFAYRQVRARQNRRELLAQMAAFQGRKQIETQTGLQRNQIGEQMASKLPITSLAAWRLHFEWARRGGHYSDQGFGSLVFTAFAYGLAGSMAILLNPSPAAFIVPVLAFVLPFSSLRTKANRVRRQAERAIPEAAALIAAELSTGISPDQALYRATQLPGPLAKLLDTALNQTTDTGHPNTGRPLFSRGKVRGTLKTVCQEAGLPVLLTFATQLDLVAEKGVAGGFLMNEIARSLAREYRERVIKEVETLDNKLTQAVALFFFAPELLLILGSFFSAILKAI